MSSQGGGETCGGGPSRDGGVGGRRASDIESRVGVGVAAGGPWAGVGAFGALSWPGLVNPP